MNSCSLDTLVDLSLVRLFLSSVKHNAIARKAATS